MCISLLPVCVCCMHACSVFYMCVDLDSSGIGSGPSYAAGDCITRRKLASKVPFTRELTRIYMRYLLPTGIEYENLYCIPV